MDISPACTAPVQPPISAKDRAHPLFREYQIYRSAMTRLMVEADRFDNWLYQREREALNISFTKHARYPAFMAWMQETARRRQQAQPCAVPLQFPALAQWSALVGGATVQRRTPQSNPPLACFTQAHRRTHCARLSRTSAITFGVVGSLASCGGTSVTARPESPSMARWTSRGWTTSGGCERRHARRGGSRPCRLSSTRWHNSLPMLNGHARSAIPASKALPSITASRTARAGFSPMARGTPSRRTGRSSAPSGRYPCRAIARAA